MGKEELLRSLGRREGGRVQLRIENELNRTEHNMRLTRCTYFYFSNNHDCYWSKRPRVIVMDHHDKLLFLLKHMVVAKKEDKVHSIRGGVSGSSPGLDNLSSYIQFFHKLSSPIQNTGFYFQTDR